MRTSYTCPKGKRFRVVCVYKTATGYAVGETFTDSRSVANHLVGRYEEAGSEAVAVDLSRPNVIKLNDKLERIMQKVNPPFDDEIPF